MVKSVSSTTASPGATVTYTITYQNTGQTTLTGVVVTDDPDEDYVASISNISNGGTYAGGVITWSIGTLNPGSRSSVTYDVTLRGTAAFPIGTTTVRNVAVITTDQTEPEDDDASVRVTRTSPQSGGGGGIDLAGEPTCFFDVDMLGEVTRIYVTCQDGRCIGNYEPDDPSDKNYLEFNGGTRVTYNLDGEFNGGPPRWVRMHAMDSPPPTSEGQVAVTPVYSFIGYTATGLPTDSVFFDAAVGMQLDYDPDALPENTTGVGIAGWNEDTYQWEFLPQATGRVAGVGTATGDVMHFSTFAVLATTGEAVSEAPAAVATPAAPAGSRPATFSGSNLQIEPAVERLWSPLTFVTRTGNTVTITAVITNVGDESGIYVADLTLNGKVVGSQDVSLAGGEQKQVRFVVSRIAAGDYRIQIGELSGAFTSAREVTWWLIAVVIALAVGLAGWFALHQRRKKQIA